MERPAVTNTLLGTTIEVFIGWMYQLTQRFPLIL